MTDPWQKLMDQSRHTALTALLRSMTRFTRTTMAGEVLKTPSGEDPELLADRVINRYGLRGFEFVIQAKQP